MFPLVVKPSTASGSLGVSVVRDEPGLIAARTALEAAGHEAVVEEYVAGPSLSLEVLCWGGRAVHLQVTGLEFDEAYDCKRVVAPVEMAAGEAPDTEAAGGEVPDAEAAPGRTARASRGPAWSGQVTASVLDAMDRVSVTLAEELGLRGLMDVEAMVHDGRPKVLEIDARLPSQTPTAVYWSSGLNIVELLARTVGEGRTPAVDRRPRRACVYQHVRAADGRLAVAGEHVMAAARPLTLVSGFFGAHEALTDYAPGRPEWAATLITLGASVAEARSVADDVAEALAAEENLQLQLELECS